MHGSTMGSMQSLQMSRRNDRGYNSDMDGGHRGSRGGSMRGRGGSRGGPRGGSSRNPDNRYNTGSTFSDYINNVDRRKGGMGQGRGGTSMPTSNGRPMRSGPGAGPPRDRVNRIRPPVDAAAGGDREQKWFLGQNPESGLFLPLLLFRCDFSVKGNNLYVP